MLTPISIKYTAPKLRSIPGKSADINLLYYVLVPCGLYLKLKGATIEKSDRTTLKRLAGSHSSDFEITCAITPWIDYLS